MPNFIFAYHGGTTPSSPEDIDAAMAAWNAWFERMGADAVDPGNPVGGSSTVFADRVEYNGGSNPLSGYSVVRADTLDAAVQLAKGCPIVADGSGSVEVAEIFEM